MIAESKSINIVSLKKSHDSSPCLTNPTKMDIYRQKTDDFARSLMNGEIPDTLVLQNERNIKAKERYQELLSSVIPLYTINPIKLTIPIIDKINIEETDTADIKKMIRKLNIQTQSFTCDHTKHDKKYDNVLSEVGKIYLSKEMREIEEFNKHFTSCLLNIENKDKYNKVSPEYNDRYSASDFEKHNRNIIAVNNRLIELDSYFKSLSCAKCDHIVKLHKITLETIEEMREENALRLRKSEQMKEDVAEDKYSVEKFMLKQYPNLVRLPLTDISNRYKELFGIKKTQAALKDELTNLGYSVTSVSHKLFVSK